MEEKGEEEKEEEEKHEVEGERVSIREMGGAPRNPAPGNHSLVRIVNQSGCHCADALGRQTYCRVPTSLRSTSPFSDEQIGKTEQHQ